MSDFDFSFLLEVLVGGLLSGVMYSLVAIGFVLIYKTSGVLNFAQGSMVLFAALTFVGFLEHGVPFFVSLAVTLVIMGVLGVVVERAVLRPLVNKPPIILFMATLGLAYILEGAAQLIWGTQVHGLDLGFDDTPLQIRRCADQPVRSVRCGSRGDDGGAPHRVLPLHAHRSRLPRRRRRSVCGARGRSSPACDLGDRLGGGGLCRSGRGPAVGRASWASSSRCRWSCSRPCRFWCWAVSIRSSERSSADSSSAPPRSWPKSISARSSAAASKSGSPMSSRSASSSFGRPGCSASSSSKGFER